jgi:hypothetical protein
VFLGSYGGFGQNDELTPEEKVQQEERQKKLLSEMRVKVTKILQKWAKEADFEALGKKIVEYAKGHEMFVDFKIVGKNFARAFEEKEVKIPLSQMLFLRIEPLILKRVDIEFHRIPIREAFLKLAKGVNYALPEGEGLAEKRVTCRFKNTPRIDILSSILDVHNYCLKQEGDGHEEFPSAFPEEEPHSDEPYWWLERLVEPLVKRREYWKPLQEKFTPEYIRTAIFYKIIIDNADKLSELYFHSVKEMIDRKRFSMTLVVTKKERR